MMTRTLRKPSSCPPASLPQRLMVRSLRLALLGLSVSAPAWAQTQTQTTTSDSALPQVTVTAGQQEQATGPVHGFVAKRSATATKTDTPITEIPQSISVVTADQIAAQQARSVSEALGYTSGVQVSTGAFAVVDTGSLLRGFALNNGGSFYRDGMLTASNASYSRYAPEPYGLERIELLHGPASVMFGQNSPGGLINVVSKKPTTSPLHELQVQVGSFDRKQVAGDFGGALDEAGVWSYRITGLARDAGTQVDGTVDRRVFLAPAITWHPSAATEWTGRFEYQRSDGLANNLFPASGTVSANPNGQIPTSTAVGRSADNNEHYENWSLSSQFSHQFNEVWSFRQNLRYTDYNGERNSMRFAAFYPATQSATAALQRWRLGTDSDTFTTDNQLQADFSTGAVKHKVLMGVDFHHTGGTVRGYVSPNTLAGYVLSNLYTTNYRTLPAVAENYNLRTVDDQLGVYLQDQLQIAERWFVSAGLRHDRSQQTVNNAIARTNSERSDRANTRNLGLVHELANGLSPYLSYTESFTPTTGTSFGGDMLKPERAKQYEAGLKYAPLNTNALFTLAVFDLRRQNVATADLLHAGYSLQTGAARSKGVELEGKVALTDGLSLTSSYSYTNAKVTSNTSTSSATSTEGKALPGAAKHNAGVLVDYGFQRGMLAGTHLSAGVRYIGRAYGNALNTFETPAVTLLDFGARLDLGRWNADWRNIELALKLNNVTDRVYAFCSEYCEYGARRTGLIQLSTRW
ncbi:TonB-dependent siderophore receptor [Herbaspirillum rubrisubalbicans M1]|uniref:TonB-dependent siderophore receptor n=1 Tax=Herbaspirillum rubrisubalbicans TaxID=80842 RepID=UPI00073AC094|nr:TonB-dependent siderophore receptor [Herbaspirillum rubrisubalbicans]ALU89417.1 TonB-dependent siderophore receptor [Herbaspirillum rubrisubalbicans M1]